MANYIGRPTLEAGFLKPSRMRVDVRGNAIDGGRNGMGEAISIEMAGGGLVMADYSDCFVQAREEHEYVNWLSSYLNGSFRFINVPIKSEWAGPYPEVNGVPTPIITGVHHSDGTLFDDGSGYSQATVYGEITEAAALNAGRLKFRLIGAARDLRLSDWFSIEHPTKGWRAYRYWQVNSRSDAESPIYDLSITPTLRQAVSVGDHVEFGKPRFVAKFATGFTLPWEAEGFWRSRPTVSFVEAF